MITYSYLKPVLSRNICRDCLNVRFRLRLRKKDCQYFYYPYVCHCCGEVKHIVSGLCPLSRIRLWGGRKAKGGPLAATRPHKEKQEQIK